MGGDEAMVRLEGVGVRLGGADVLRNLDLRIDSGDLLGLLGPNGAGKTTIVRLLSGVLRASSGRASIEGRPIRNFTPRELARTVAVVPQDGGMPFPFLVEEVVLMGRSPHLGQFAFEGEEDRRIVAEAMEATETTRFARREIGSLSGGERQRVLIARALAQEPRLLLLDEPTSFLDLRHQVGLLELLIRLNRDRGLTILTVSHDLNLAARTCRRIALLRDGTVVSEGEPADVLTERTLRDVYGVDVTVIHPPGASAPIVIPPLTTDRSRGSTP